MAKAEVAIDVGYGFVKGVFESSRVHFASAVIRAPDLSVGAALGGMGGENVYEINGESYLVGEAALEAGAQRSWATDAAGRRDYPLLVAAALAKLRVPAGDIQLRVGVPLGHYSSGRAALRDALDGAVFRITDHTAKNTYFRVAEVRVYPQGVGAYAAAVADQPDLRRKPVGVVDIGYRTTDYLIVRHTADGRARPLRWGSADVGWQSVAAFCRDAVASDKALPINLEQIERALESGEFWWRGRRVELPLSQAEQELAQRVADAVQHAWRDEIDALAAVIVAGGAGARLAGLLPWPHVVVAPDPFYANARGYLLL
ncbi:MAG: ParM/StbA family protein [Clostridiales bacterium]|nr:ParM/StbA family protein [Clostridiales bacterium]